MFDAVWLRRCENLSHGVPHFPEKTKEDSGMRLRYHVVVAIVHGDTRRYVYNARENVPHDPNLTIEVLQHTLAQVEANRGRQLPKTFYLQLDICIRENKNTAVMAYVLARGKEGVQRRIRVLWSRWPHAQRV